MHLDLSSKIEPVGIISSTISPEHNSSESAVKYDFTIPDKTRKLVDTPCRRVKVSHRCRSKPNSNIVKYQTSFKKGVMALPGFELLRSPSSREKINNLDKKEN